MRRAVTVAIIAALTAAAGFGAVTLIALEINGVAVLRTTGIDGNERRTRVWFAEDDGALWIEAATASRPFYVDLAVRPELVVEIHSSPLDQHPTMLRGRAELVPEPGGHDRIRALLAARYGWADAWIALLQDTSASRAARIAVESAAPEQ